MFTLSPEVLIIQETLRAGTGRNFLLKKYNDIGCGFLTVFHIRNIPAFLKLEYDLIFR